jgi:hypothetical protein
VVTLGPTPVILALRRLRQDSKFQSFWATEHDSVSKEKKKKKPKLLVGDAVQW